MKYFKDYQPQDQTMLSEEICPKATPEQINYFLRFCDSKSISPFSGLAYLTLRRLKTGEVKAAIGITVDASRLSASRSGEYAGSDEPEYDCEDKKNPTWCRVTVYRTAGDERRAYTAKCRYDEFKPESGKDYMWNQKPYHMLAKVTEVQALRKAFPDFVYGQDEDHDSSHIEPASSEPTKDDISLRDRLIKFQTAVQAFSEIGFSEDNVLKELNIADKKEITDQHLESLRVLYKENQAKEK